MTCKEEVSVKVEPISNGNLRIWLSEEELQQHTRDIGEHLREMLQAVQARLSRLGKHILVERIPVDGGWIVLISARRSATIGGAGVYRIADVDTLFRLAEQWASLPNGQGKTHTTLYETADGYALAVYSAPRLTRRQTSLLQEFGERIGRGDAAVAYVAERGRLLAAGDALGKFVLTEREPRPPEPSDRES